MVKEMAKSTRSSAVARVPAKTGASRAGETKKAKPAADGGKSVKVASKKAAKPAVSKSVKSAAKATPAAKKAAVKAPVAKKAAARPVAAKPNIVKPVARPVAKRSAAAVKKPVKPAAVKVAPKKAATPVAKKVAKPVAKVHVKAPAKQPAKPVAKSAAGKAVAKPVAKKAVAPVTKQAAKAPAVKAAPPSPSKETVLPKVVAKPQTGKSATAVAVAAPRTASAVSHRHSHTNEKSLQSRMNSLASASENGVTREDGRYALPSTTNVELPKGYRPASGEEYMSPRQLAYFRNKLRDWREQLVEESRQTMDNLREEVRDVGDEAERATRETENSLELRTRDRYRKLIAKIDGALRRIEDGRYGYCEETDEEIGVERLDARPIATLSLDAQERREHLQKQMGD